MRMRIVAVGVALVALSALAGCGGGESNSLLPKNVSGAPVSWGEPSGKPRGLVMLIPGGGWQRSPSEYEGQKTAANSFQDQGYATVAIEYDAGAKGFRQIEDTYKVARKQYPNLPICASGISAGGNFALMLASREPDLTCVLALVAPTDLTTLAAQDPSGDEAYKDAVTAFGKDQLAKFSPVRYADKIKAKVLLIVAEADPIVPAEQGRELAAALPSLNLLVLPPGPVQAQFAHFGGVQEDAQDTVIERDFEFLKEATQGH